MIIPSRRIKQDLTLGHSSAPVLGQQRDRCGQIAASTVPDQRDVLRLPPSAGANSAISCAAR